MADLPRFKVASYNIHKAVGTDRRRDPLRILAVLREIDADIVALQEADRRFGARQAAVPPSLIAQHSDYVPVPFGLERGSLGWHGNAILVKRGIAIEEHTSLPIPCLEPRGAVRARLRLADGTRIVVFATHLDLSGLWRVRQARALAALADKARRDGPTLLMGDLNEWRRNAGCFRALQDGLRLLDPGPSFHSRAPVGRLDRIYHCNSLEAHSCGVHRSALARTASDHLPVWAELSPLP